MSPDSKRERMAALHRQMILESAKELFLQQGYEAVNMDELCRVSTYSRRTIYKYFAGKEDVYLHLVYNGLAALHADLVEAINSTPYFMARYRAICTAMKAYHAQYPHAVQAVNHYKSGETSPEEPLKITQEIFAIGESVNQLLTAYIKEGIEQGIVLETVQARQTMYVLWAGISALLDMAALKTQHLEEEFGMPVDDFLQYGFDQLIDGILEDRIHGTA